MRFRNFGTQRSWVHMLQTRECTLSASTLMRALVRNNSCHMCTWVKAHDLPPYIHARTRTRSFAQTPQQPGTAQGGATSAANSLPQPASAPAKLSSTATATPTARSGAASPLFSRQAAASGKSSDGADAQQQGDSESAGTNAAAEQGSDVITGTTQQVRAPLYVSFLRFCRPLSLHRA